MAEPLLWTDRLIKRFGGLIAGIAGPALAADLPYKAPLLKAPPVVVYSWTGCYLGVEGGWISDRKTFNKALDELQAMLG